MVYSPAKGGAAMKLESHRILGRYLADAYLQELPKRHMQAFLLGCILPDRNPATYLKGSARARWLRGHNWSNANRYIRRLCIRLEDHRKPGIWAFYSLGKLIHYTADAFTLAHNDRFPTAIRLHRSYEAQLHHRFDVYLSLAPLLCRLPGRPMAEIVFQAHRCYETDIPGPDTDLRYTLDTCSALLCRFCRKIFASHACQIP